MKNHETVNQLESRIEELEYRISILEKYIDTDDSLLAKHDRSMMDSIRIFVMGTMKQKGYNTNLFKDRLGKKFYLED
ncbi:MAG: hypothetical protein ACJA1A_001802 [Saprospiraceae bacterium]|jgi:hypothetical protein